MNTAAPSHAPSSLYARARSRSREVSLRWAMIRASRLLWRRERGRACDQVRSDPARTNCGADPAANESPARVRLSIWSLSNVRRASLMRPDNDALKGQLSCMPASKEQSQWQGPAARSAPPRARILAPRVLGGVSRFSPERSRTKHLLHSTWGTVRSIMYRVNLDLLAHPDRSAQVSLCGDKRGPRLRRPAAAAALALAAGKGRRRHRA